MKTKPYTECNFLRFSNGRSVCVFDARGDQIDYCTQHGCPIRDKSSDEFRVMDLQWATWEEVESDPDYTGILSPPTSNIEWEIIDKGEVHTNAKCNFRVKFAAQTSFSCVHEHNSTSLCTFASCPIKIGDAPKERDIPIEWIVGIDYSASNCPFNYRGTCEFDDDNRVDCTYESCPIRKDKNINDGKSIPEIAGRIAKLVEEKQIAYGNSFNLSGEILKLLYPNGVKPDQYPDMLCVVRIIDKLFRIASQKEAFDENPYDDIVGYGLLGAKYL